MNIKGFAAAHRHKGGFEKWVYDMIKELSESESSENTNVEAIEAAIGDEETEGTILYRIKALETAAEDSNGG